MPSKQSRTDRLLRSFKSRTIGVLGDYMLDELLRGEATRISPEAPVPVVLMSDPNSPDRFFPGGAGNVAANLSALGGHVIAFGAIGNDASGRRLGELLKKRGIASPMLVREAGRITPHKIRVVAHQHQLVRLDIERAQPLSLRTTEALARGVARHIGRLDALVLSDYRKGTLTLDLCNRVKSLARQRRLPVFVDPKPEALEVCRHATLVTPNLREAELMAGTPLRNSLELHAGGRRLLAALNCSYLLITRGAEGMTLFEAGGAVHEIPSIPRPVYDVTGAGDTVLAVLALAITSGATMHEAAELANLAAGRVVLKFGTAEISAAELREALARNSPWP